MKHWFNPEGIKRYCRVCNTLLPVTRYFNCIACIDIEDSDHDALGLNDIQEIYL